MHKPHEEHKKKVSRKINFAVITVSTSRWNALKRGEKIQDISGDLAEELIRKRGHNVVIRKIVPDDMSQIRAILEESIKENLDIVIFIGGTGITRDDVTIEAVKPLLDKEIMGFGEIFRYLSYEEIGSSAFLSRALGGVIKSTAVFCIPGSPGAVKLALEKLILEEAGHITYLIKERK